MRGGNYTERGNTFLLATLRPEDEIFLGLFIIAAFWALFSGAVVLLSIHEMAQRSAWRWATSLAAAALVMAYCFWKQLSGTSAMVRDKSFSHHDSKEALQQRGRALCRLVNRSGRPYLDNLLYELVNDPGVQAEFRDSLGLCERERGQKGSFRCDVPMKSVLDRALSHFSDSLKALDFSHF